MVSKRFWKKNPFGRVLRGAYNLFTDHDLYVDRKNSYEKRLCAYRGDQLAKIETALLQAKMSQTAQAEPQQAGAQVGQYTINISPNISPKFYAANLYGDGLYRMQGRGRRTN